MALRKLINSYADFNYYSTTYKGKHTEDAIAIYLELASRYIDSKTFNRLKADASLLCDDVKLATCIQADFLLNKSETSGGLISGQSVEGNSITYNDKECDPMVLKLLRNTNLMYRGF